MGKRREEMSKIVSLVTGVPEDRLEEFEVLKELLDAADNPGTEEGRYELGLITFCWPHEGRPLLVLVNTWSSALSKLGEIENTFWPYCARPVYAFAQFSLTDDKLVKARVEAEATAG